MFIYYYLFVLFISIIYLLGKTLQDFINDLWCFKSGDYFPNLSNCIYQCLLYAVIIYHILFIIVVLILLHLSYCVNVCHVFVCIFVWDHNGNKCLHFFVSSFYLMYFVFISYVYLYNVLHFILNKSNPMAKT